MKKKTFYIIACLLPVFASCGKTTQEQPQKAAAAPLSALKVSGNVFTNAEGDTVRLMGVSFSDPDKLEREGQWSLRYFEEARNWGCNVVRLPIHTYTWRYRGKDDYLRLLDQGVEWAAQTGMYVILDWHAIGNLPGDAWPGFNYMTNWKETVATWKTLVEHFKGNPTVACYELFNEPTDCGAPLSWAAWRPLMEQLIDSTNTVDNGKIYLVAGMNWAYELDSVLVDPVKRPNVAYVTHPYPQKREQPWEPKWEADFGHVADVYPVVATEFGFVIKGERGEHNPVVGDETYGKTIMDYFARKGISYTVWCFDPSWSPALLDDFDFTPQPRQGVFFKNALQQEAKGK